jgi:hypothetical protein
MVMVFNSTFNIISVISWRSVLLVEKTRVPRENLQPAASHWQTLSHNVVSSTPLLSGIRTHTFSGEGYVRHSLILSDKQSTSKDKNTALFPYGKTLKCFMKWHRFLHYGENFAVGTFIMWLYMFVCLFDDV